MADIAIKGNRLTAAKGGRIGKFGGGRTNLLEELGRVEAEPSNRNRRAEISRVHGELNRGYKHGGKTKTPQHYLVHGYGSTYKPKRTRKVIGGVVKGGRHIGKLLKKVGKEIKDQPLPPQLKGKAEELKKAFPHHDSKGRLKKAEGGRASYAAGGIAAAHVKGALKAYKKYKKKKKLVEDTKKGKFPETESLTHQKGPYVGDVGSERPGIKRREWKTPDWPKRPKRPEWSPPKRKFPPDTDRRMIPPKDKFPRPEGKWEALKKGGKVDKKWIQKAVNPKHKGYCTPMTKKTCTPARKALARTFKKKAKTGW